MLVMVEDELLFEVTIGSRKICDSLQMQFPGQTALPGSEQSFTAATKLG